MFVFYLVLDLSLKLSENFNRDEILRKVIFFAQAVSKASINLKEISYIQREGFTTRELKHGTIALIEEGTPVLVLLSDLVLVNHTRGKIQEDVARGAKILTIAEENVARETECVEKFL